MSPEQELYDKLFINCISILDEEHVYDYLPPAEVSYPFIRIGDVNTNGSPTGTSIGGEYTITIDVWGSQKQKIEVAELTDKIYQLAKGYFKTEHFNFYAFPNQQSKRLMQDTSVPNTVFNRGNLMLSFRLD